jgi:subtilisin family serine protease
VRNVTQQVHLETIEPSKAMRAAYERDAVARQTAATQLIVERGKRESERIVCQKTAEMSQLRAEAAATVLTTRTESEARATLVRAQATAQSKALVIKVLSLFFPSSFLFCLVGCFKVWRDGHKGAGVNVAVIDTGIKTGKFNLQSRSLFFILYQRLTFYQTGRHRRRRHVAIRRVAGAQRSV